MSSQIICLNLLKHVNIFADSGIVLTPFYDTKSSLELDRDEHSLIYIHFNSSNQLLNA